PRRGCPEAPGRGRRPRARRWRCCSPVGPWRSWRPLLGYFGDQPTGDWPCLSTRRRAAGPGAARRARRSSADLEELDVEDQRGVRRDHAARTARAVALLGRDHEAALAADLHALHALVPTGDHVAGAELEAEEVPAVDGAVELA